MCRLSVSKSNVTNKILLGIFSFLEPGFELEAALRLPEWQISKGKEVEEHNRDGNITKSPSRYSKNSTRHYLSYDSYSRDI